MNINSTDQCSKEPYSRSGSKSQLSMKYLVVAVLCVGFIIAACDAACFHWPPPERKPGGKPIRGCVFEGKRRRFGSEWLTKECQDCSCSSDGSVSCCNKLGLPMQFDSDRCVYVEDRKSCTWRVVTKEDHSIDCY